MEKPFQTITKVNGETFPNHLKLIGEAIPNHYKSKWRNDSQPLQK